MTARTPVAPDAIPVIIAGAPRSGTTFLTTALNTHPQVMITNELRAWIVFNDLRRRTKQTSESLPEHPLRDSFRRELLRQCRTMFYRFYHEEVTKEMLGCPASTGDSVEQVIKAFGDKNPSYADSHSAGCIDLIADLLHGARFIHIHRDPRSCVASYRDIKVYSNEITRCTSTWLRHTRTMAKLADRLGPKRVLEFAYEDFVSSKGEEIFQQIEAHIGVDHACEPIDFLNRERAKPVPYRSPTTAPDRLGQATFVDRLTPAEVRAVEARTAALMERYGYVPTQPEPVSS